jgi:hypothetical protein
LIGVVDSWRFNTIDFSVQPRKFYPLNIEENVVI